MKSRVQLTTHFWLGCVSARCSRGHFLGGSAKLVWENKPTLPNHTMLPPKPGSGDLRGLRGVQEGPQQLEGWWNSDKFHSGQIMRGKHTKNACLIWASTPSLSKILAVLDIERFGNPQLCKHTEQIHLLCLPENILGLQTKWHPPPLQNPLLVAIGFSSGISTHAPADHNWQSSLSLMKCL